MSEPLLPAPRISPVLDDDPAPLPVEQHATGQEEASADELDLSHDFAVAATIPVDEQGAKLAIMRRFHIVKPHTKVRAVDVYCEGCHLAYHLAVDKPCSAKMPKPQEKEHLIGGDQAHRKKRVIVAPPEGAERLEGPKIDRRGVRAVVLGP